MYLIVQLINGLQIGSIYALIALGYTMVYGIVKLINFAHGDIMMIGSYFTLLLMTGAGVPFLIAVPISMLACAVLGILIERLAYKPLRQASRLSALITAIGVSLFLQNLAMIIFSSNARSFPMVAQDFPKISLGQTTINLVSIVSILAAVLLMLVLQVFIKKTKVGKAMIAVSEDMKAAQLMGINVDHTISITFAIGSALAAFAAGLFLVSYPQVTPYMGALPGIKAFIAAVLGGIGNIPGAMVGGLLLGIVETMTKAFIPSAYSQLADGVVFVVLAAVLLFKPTGLLGKNLREKV